MIPAVILAAGDSRRMGSPKALLLTPAGQTFLVSIVDALASAGITDIVVVTGRHHDRIVEALRSVPRAAVSTRVARNPDPGRGQLSSLLVGMDVAVGPDTPAFLVTLVDVPMLTAATVESVVDAWRRSGAPIVRPAIGERHGHPVLFDRTVFDELRSAPLDVGAKAVLRANEGRVVNVPVSDSGCLIDVDTPADYGQLSG